MVKHFKVALVGQPNCGKSTIFNLLSGAKQHIANYPGITVDKKSAFMKIGDKEIELIDLPGAYSLSSYSDEESVVSDLLLEGGIDLVINIVDASNFKRNLYLTTQVLEVGIPTIIFLNMMDVAKDKGYEFNLQRLEEILNVEAIGGVGYKDKTKELLKEKIAKAINGEIKKIPSCIKFDEIEKEIGEFIDFLLLKTDKQDSFPHRWLALRLLEENGVALNFAKNRFTSFEEIKKSSESIRVDIEKRLGSKIDMFIASKRYDFAQKLEDSVITKYKERKRDVTTLIDSIVLNKFLSLPLMIGVIFLLYELSIVQGYKLTEYTYPLLAWFKQVVVDMLPAASFIDVPLVTQFGVWMVNSINALLNYIPIFIILFALIAMLEDSGYMARMAFSLDRIFKNYGLHGQSTLPYVLSGVFVGGCAVPGVMATKGIADPKAKMATILTVPFLNCLAKVPFFVLIVSIFFDEHKSLVMFFISTITIMVALIVARVLSVTLLKSEKTLPFIMEMPNYHMPRVKNVLFSVKEKIWLYIKKVMTIVVAVAAVLFVLVQFPGVSSETLKQTKENSIKVMNTFFQKSSKSSYFSYVNDEKKLTDLLNYEEEYRQKRMLSSSKESLERLDSEFKKRNEIFFKILRDRKDRNAKLINSALKEVILYRKQTLKLLNDEKINNSYLGKIGRSMECITKYAGFDWRINVAFLSSFAARESFVATLGALFEAQAGGEDKGGTLAIDGNEYSPLVALAMIVFMALTPPCIATLIVIKAQTNSYKWMLFALFYPIFLALVIAMLIYSGGSYFNLGALEVMGIFYFTVLAILILLGVWEKPKFNLIKRSNK